MKKIFLYVFLISLISTELMAESNDEIIEDIERNRYIFYIAPLYMTNYTEQNFRNRLEDKSFTFLYGLTNEFFMGINYSAGRDPSSRLLNGIFSSYSFSEFKSSRQGEYLSLKFQYFVYGNFYLGLNLGVERGFKVSEGNRLRANNNIFSIDPYSKTTIVSDRNFSTLGFGYRKEFWSNFIFGLELEYGLMSSSKVRDHYTFNPEFYRGIPLDYYLDQILFRRNEKSTSEFSVFYIYFGISF